ncbi:MAG TPA: hypothetical protein VN786_02470, partial [Acidimicrobiales bacterium]|nr:hypothetical protein [Acidimicrobiales bacterium]
RRRALIDSALRWGLLSLAAWCLAMTVLLVWSKLSPTAHMVAWAGVLGALAVSSAVVGWALDRPGILEVARVADAQLDLGERLASAVSFARSPGEMGSRLRADAVYHAQAHRAGEAFPFRRHRREATASVVAAVMVLGLVLAPNPQAGALRRQAARSEALAQAKEAVVTAERELAKASSPEAAKAVAALRQALSRLGAARTPLSALVTLSELDSRLGSLDNSNFEAEQEADAAASAALAGSPGASELSRALAGGDLKAAATALRALAADLPKISQRQRKALAAGLEQAATEAGGRADGAVKGARLNRAANADAPFADVLGRAGTDLAAGRTAAAGNALGNAAAGAEASASAASAQQELQAVQAAVRNAQAEVARQAQAELAGTGRGGTASGAQIAANGHGIGAGAKSRGGPGGSSGSGTAAGSGRAPRSGTGTGSGGGTASSGATSRATRPRLREGSGSGQAGPGPSGPGGNSYAKGRNARSAQVFVAGQPGRAEQVVGQKLGNGEGVATTGYRAVLPAFEKTALQGLGSQVLGPEDQGLVRAYFSSLGDGT